MIVFSRTIEKPIFILGSGRSGTTVLYNLLAAHPDVCWFSTLSDLYPQFPSVSCIQRILDFPFFGRQLRRRISIGTAPYVTTPAEGARIYHEYCGFEHSKRTTSRDISESLERRFKGIIVQHLIGAGKRRFLNKQTANTQRMGLMSALFPDAYFIHIIRDGRAVANSLYRVSWWPTVRVWWWDGRTPIEWEKMGRDALELCALHWQHNIQEVQRMKKAVNKRYLEVYYEELISDVHGVIRSICEHCELSISDYYDGLLPTTLPNMNSKWKQQLTKTQQRSVERLLEKLLGQLGYM